jgi:hypothetical protein
MSKTPEPKSCGICGLTDQMGDSFHWISVPGEEKILAVCIYCACGIVDDLLNKFVVEDAQEALKRSVYSLVISTNGQEIPVQGGL